MVSNDSSEDTGMLTQRAVNKLVDETNVAFNSIGTKPPVRSVSNTERIAFEFWVSSHLYKQAETRRKAAVVNACEAGVIFDVEDQDNWRPPGTHEPTYMSDLVTVILDVAKPRVILDQKKLVAELIKAGVRKEVIGKAMDRASSTSRPGHKFNASLNVKEAIAAAPQEA